MRVVTDTNVVVSGVCLPDSVCGRVLSVAAQQFSLAFSPKLVDEILNVVARPKLDRFGPRINRIEAVTILFSSGTMFSFDAVPTRCRDAKPRARACPSREGRLFGHR